MKFFFDRIKVHFFKWLSAYFKPKSYYLKSIGIFVLLLGQLFIFSTGANAAGLSGSYTIDGTGAGSYKTFALAVADLNTNGVSGPVVFNVTAATYTENITLGTIAGISSTNSVTFRGKGRSLTTLTSASNTLGLSGSTYINFDQMTISTTVASKTLIGAYLINLKNSSFCSITNCIIKGPLGTGILYLVNDSNATNLTINNNNVTGGSYGIYSYGIQASNGSGFLQCTNNRFSGQNLACYYGLYSYQDNFSYNVCDSANSTLTYTMYNQYENGPIVNGNKFYAASGIGLDMLQENFYPVSGKPVNAIITNNFFTNSTTDQVFDNPQNLTGSTGGWVFAFNTIYNTTASTYGAAIEPQTCGGGTCIFASNIIYSSKGTPLYFNGLNTYSNAFVQYNGNDIYFTTGSISFIFGSITTTYATYALYAAAVQNIGFDLNGTNFNPTFKSIVKPFDLHLSTTVAGPVGVSVSGITTDIDLATRYKLPSAGGNESSFGIANNNAGIVSLVSPKNPCPGTTVSVTVDFANLGSNAINTGQIGWSVDGNVQSTVTYSGSSIPVYGDAVVTLGTYNFSASSLHKLKAWPIKPNGSADPKASDDTLIYNITMSLSGNYTINASGSGSSNFTTFSAAAAYVNSYGICGPVVFNVAAATFTESVYLGSITGLSATNNIIFRGAGRSNTILTSAGSTLSLPGLSYVTFDQMTIVTTVTGKLKAGYNVVNASNTSSCSITNCIVKGPVGTGILYLLNDSNAINLTIFNNNISGGYYGIYSFGIQASNSSGLLQCTYNRFSAQQNACYYGNYSFQDNFSYNVCDSSNASLPYTYFGQFLNGPVVTGNKFYAGSVIGLDMIQENFYPVSGNPVTAYITNNFFTNSTTQEVYDNPQNLSSTTGNWVFAFNTIYNTTGTTGISILPQTCGTSTCIFASNIIYSTKGTPLLVNATNSTTAFSKYDGNDINFSTGSVSFTYGTTTSTYASYALYIAAVQGYGYDLLGTNFAPTFVSTAKPFDLHLSPTVQGPVGVWVSGITIDIDKNYRIKYTAAGAAESYFGGIVANDAGIIGLISPTVVCPGNSASVIVDLANLGSNPINKISVGWSWDGISMSPITVGAMTLPNDALVNLGTQTFAAGVTHKLKAWPIQPNGVSDGKASNDTLIVNVGPSLTGTYTINASGGNTSTNFTSFNNVAVALNANGICGPVFFKVSPGTYNEQVQLNNVAGTSSKNTITFDGVDSSKTILTFNGTALAPHTFRLNGSSYVTVKRMSILNPSTAGAIAVHITGGANNNTFTNCIIKVDASSTSAGVIAVGIIGATNTTIGNNGNFNIINNNIINGGWGNVVLYGNSATLLCSGNQVTNNILTSGYLYGISATYQTGFLFSSNKISTRLTAAGSTTIIGGCLGSYSGTTYASTNAIAATSCANHVISNNICNANIGGILDVNADVAVLGGKSLIYNNICYGMQSPSTTAYGIYVNVGYSTGVYHNTIYFTSLVGNALFITNTGASASQGIDIRNNIVYKTSSCSYAANIAASSVVSNMDYNDIYSLTGNYVSFLGTAYGNLTALMAANPAYNQHSWSTDPGFVSLAPGSEDFHWPSTSYGIYGNYVNVDKDKDGNQRCKEFPNIGVYESLLGKAKPVVKFFITSNIYPGSPSFVYQTAKAGEPKLHSWYLNGVHVSDSVVLKTTAFVAGSNTLKLVTTYCGGKDSFQLIFTIKNPTKVPVTDFVANKNYISTGQTVIFLDQSTNGPISWNWQISPDSVIMNGAKVPAFSWISSNNFSQNPQIQFNGSGKYNVCLTATNGIGKGNKLCKTSYITVIPGINLGSVTTVTDREGFLFDDGGPNGNYLGGKLTPSLVIAPCADSIYLTFSMFDMSCGNAFVQLFEGKTTTGKRLDPCGGTGLSSGFTGGSSSGLSCATVCLPNVFKPDTFAAKSAMTIQMNDGATVLGAGFAAHWWSKPLTGIKPAKASFTTSGSGDSVCTNGQTNFVNTSTAAAGDIVTYLWDLDGDPTTFECVGACSTAIWPYFLPGTVNVTLIATSCGGSDTMTKKLTIYNPKAPKAAVLADNVSPSIGDVVFFSAPIPVCIETYEWTITKSGTGSGYASFVNGTHNYSSNPQVVFSDTGYYTVKLYVDNLSGQQKDSITMLKYIHVRSPYCIPSVALINQGMGISKFSFNTLSNTMSQAAHEYTNYTSDQSLTTTVAQGVKYPVSISRNPTLNFDALNRSVFIDWNQDGSFTGAGEEAAEDSNSTSNTWNGTITVPRTAKTGATTMRIAVNKGSLSNKPCGQNEFGEYQDYRIYVIPFNIPPVITLTGKQGFNDTIVMEQGKGSFFVEPGYTASSYLYGNLTNNVKRTSRRLGSTNPADSFNIILPNLYVFTYSLTDSAGNKAKPQYRLVKVTKDVTAPDLIVAQPDTTIMEVTPTALSPFPAPKVISANDLVDGPLIASVVNDAANVTSNILGLYTITYSVTDISGNTATVYRYIKIIDTIRPVLALLGDSIIDLEVHNSFADPGVKSTDNYYSPGILNPMVKITSDLDIDKLGTYTVTYDLTDPSGNKAATITRLVRVIDTLAPMLTLNGAATDSMAVQTIYNDPGVSFSDNYDKNSDLTLTVSGTFYAKFPSGTKANVIGSYVIVYTVTDKSGNTSSITRFISVKDWMAPVITLNGSSGISVCRWANYVDEGYTLSDNYDVNADITVQTVGSFITNGGTTVENLLTLQYIATDKSGNTGYSQVRYIQVKSIHDWPCSASGIAPGLDLDKYITVFPNPNNGTFTINANLPSQEKIRISITNILGQEIAVIHNGILSQNSFKVDLSSQPSGMYLVNIVSDTQTLTKRIDIAK